MIRETELNLFVPSPELLVRLASGERPLGVRAGPPRIKTLRETFFDTPDQALRRRGMTCKLRQVEGEEPSVVVTVGEGPDSEGITSRSRLTAAAIGAGVFETLKGDSEPATQIQKFVDPSQLRPQIALDIQRLGRVFRGGLLLKPVLLLFFDRITVQAGGNSSVFHEVRIRRRREGGPLIRDLAQQLRDEHHLFPDGLTTLQRAYRVLAVEGKTTDQGLSPYGLSLGLAVFHDGKLALMKKGDDLVIPTFRGSGEDAARALSADLLGQADLPLLRLGTTEPRPGRAVAELWTIPDHALPPETAENRLRLEWVPWDRVLEEVGRLDLQDPTLISTLLLLTRRKLLGQLPWLSEFSQMEQGGDHDLFSDPGTTRSDATPPELRRVQVLLSYVREAENRDGALEDRVAAVSRISKELNLIFFQDMTRTKGRILSRQSDEGEEGPTRLVDMMSIRIRGIVDRLYRCLEDDLLTLLENRDVHFRTWAGLMHEDRNVLLEDFSTRHVQEMRIAQEWGPSFIPDMPPSGCAVGLMARTPGVDGTRFFHVVLRKDAPSFQVIPGSTMVLPIEEVIRGYFLKQMPELERTETHMFRFTTGAATVRVRAPEPEPRPVEFRAHEETDPVLEDMVTSPPPPRFLETRESVVVRVLVRRRMPESYQAQLIRALERQVTKRNPLIGWSDLYPVTGPLDLTGLDELLELKEK
jgi:hypothetical protein